MNNKKNNKKNEFYNATLICTKSNTVLFTADNLKEEIPNYPIRSIIITAQGEVTTCTMIENGRIKKQTQAICSPKDKPDFETGARIAFDRCCTSLAENSSFAKKEPFRPHLAYLIGGKCGYIGEPTTQTAFGGEPLFVGDCVSLYDTQRKINFGTRVVAKTDVYDNGYIMGVAGLDFVNGVYAKWQILKLVSYKDLKRNGVVDDIKVVLTDEN